MADNDIYEPLEGGAYRNENWQVTGRPRQLPAVPLSLSDEIPAREILAEMLLARLGDDRKSFPIPDGTSIALDAVEMALHFDLEMTIWLEALFRLLQQPQEIWLRFERHRLTGKVELRKRLIGSFRAGGRVCLAALVTQVERGEFVARTFIVEDEPADDIQQLRAGRLMWPPAGSSAQ